MVGEGVLVLLGFGYSVGGFGSRRILGGNGRVDFI